MALLTIQELLDGWPGWTTNFELRLNEEMSQTATTILVTELDDPVWVMRAETALLIPSEHRHWKARVQSLNNGRLFLGYDLAGKYPVLYPNGTWPTGGAFSGTSAAINSIGANRHLVGFKGLPAAYIISVGDYLSIERATDGKLELVQAMETATANGSGVTMQIEVRPPLQAGTAVDDAVSVKEPACTMMIVPGTINAPADPRSARGSVSFEAVQVF